MDGQAERLAVRWASGSLSGWAIVSRGAVVIVQNNIINDGMACSKKI